MIATRYPCALALTLLLGGTPFASAQQYGYPNNGYAIDQSLVQMAGQFPSMTPQQFVHWQNAMNQMLQAMPNDPYRNNNLNLQNPNGNPWGNPNQMTTPLQNRTAQTNGNQQNALFPGRTGVSQAAPGFNSKQTARPRPAFSQQQFTSAAQNQGHGNCRPNNHAGAAANRFGQQQAAAHQQQHHHHHHK